MPLENYRMINRRGGKHHSWIIKMRDIMFVVFLRKWMKSSVNSVYIQHYITYKVLLNCDNMHIFSELMERLEVL